MTPKLKRILIVDDDRDFVEAVSSFLEASRFRVLKAHDARDAVVIARIEHPDLILMDIMMKERTEGLFAIQQIRRIPEISAVPVFVVSALYRDTPELGIKPDAAWLRHDEFFTKPVDLALLLERIRTRLSDAA